MSSTSDLIQRQRRGEAYYRRRSVVPFTAGYWSSGGSGGSGISSRRSSWERAPHLEECVGEGALEEVL